MDEGLLTLQEAADLLGKSTQTVRRLIKKGELSAKQVQTPQGFQYAVSKASMALRFPRLQIQQIERVEIPGYPPLQEVSSKPEVFLENDYYVLESTPLPHPLDTALDKETVSSRQLFELVQLAHKEKLILITILERLQAELQHERQRPKSSFQWIQKALRWMRFVLRKKH
ncbi:helix-turn-helix domain-containing protein [Candidatus Peregrinibacteria bacterium]|nr:MAG: helix-turn-helix domain-containing protein [Candidatus Peregrinibacteria bacterium]